MKSVAFIVLVLCAPVMALEGVYEFPNVRKKDLYTQAVRVLSAEPDVKILEKNDAESRVMANCDWFIRDGLVEYPLLFTITVQASDNRITFTHDNVKIMPVMGRSDITSQYPENEIKARLAKYDQKIVDAMKQLSAPKKK